MEVAEACSNHLKPLNKYHIVFVIFFSNISSFYRFIKDKPDKFFLRSTVISILPHRLHTMFCFCWAKQRKKRTLVREKNIADAHTLFSLWKKAPQCFKEHLASYHVFIRKSKDVSEMTNDYLLSAREKVKKKVFTWCDQVFKISCMARNFFTWKRKQW